MRSLFLIFLLAQPAWAADIPASFDLRSLGAVTTVKSQSGGTCWTHGTMASIESNLIKTGAWIANGETGEPNLAEYHLDWWNGFNKHLNADIAPRTGGLTVHQGGDYLLATAYTSRLGVVRDADGQSYNSPPTQISDNYHFYYPREVIWMSAGEDLSNISAIKRSVMDHGAIGTALTWSNSFYSSSKNTFYQPPTSTEKPNHAVTIVGWDDAKVTQAPKPGAWLIKNSWGSGWGQSGYFWISYYDKIAGQHPTMGAISFRDVERFKYKKVYAHDYHGWRDTLAEASAATNVFQTGAEAEKPSAVGFYTAKDDVSYSVEVYVGFDGQPVNPVASVWGVAAQTGYHTVDLPGEAVLPPNSKVAVVVQLSGGGQPYDRSSEVPVLLCGPKTRVWVESKAQAGESYYFKDGAWVDLQGKNDSANFTIRLFTN